jgi:hypothetical protein
VLRGEVADQVALHGLLDRIQTPGLDLIEILKCSEPSLMPRWLFSSLRGYQRIWLLRLFERLPATTDQR